jgi:hypothetical protein
VHDSTTIRRRYGASVALQPSDKHYRNTVIRLPDLAVTETVLTGLTFENCEIVGPAVIVPLVDTEITRNGCRLRNIGLAVPEDQLETVRSGFGL